MFDTFFQAMLWTCKTCGYQIEGRQPMYECPLCESYKTNFIDIPQHLEAKVREAHPDKSFNHSEARTMRLEIMIEHNADSIRRAAGRILPAASGNHMNPSSD